MRNFSTKLTVALAIFALAATSAFADNKGNKKGSFGISFGGGGVGLRFGNSNHSNFNHNNFNHNNNYNHKKYNSHCGNYGGNPVYPYGQQYGMAYEPFHSFYVCQPGDSFYMVSLKEYGTSAVARHIASYNRLAQNAGLVPGQRLMLPSVAANGMLTPSLAPAPFIDATPQVPFTNPTANFTQPKSIATSSLAANVQVSATEPALPSVTVGSTLMLDGQVFGDEQGVARLRIGGLSLPVEVIEWTSSSAKIRLPQVELTAPLKAEIEVLRADGSVASKTAIELTPAASRLALGN